MDMFTITLIILIYFCSLILVAMISIGYCTGKRAFASTYTCISKKYNYIVIYKDQKSIVIEEISRAREIFLVSSEIVDKRVTVGMQVKKSTDDEELKSAGLYQIKHLGPLVRTFRK